jgi:carbamoyl-phosphate synthase small subunit
VEVTHRSLNDGTCEGFRMKERPVFAVQYHPESSPGPHDSDLLFDEFVQAIRHRGSGAGVQRKPRALRRGGK